MGAREHAVAIVGGGPTGMMLAAELTLAGVDAAIVERREESELLGSRAGGLLSRTLEVLDQRGVGERVVSQGQIMQVHNFATPIDVSDFPSRRPYGLALWQSRFEEILAGWVRELGVPILRGTEVRGFAQDADGVDVALADGGTLRAGYLVGCDGGRSVVRKTAGIAFTGWDAQSSWLIAEAQIEDESEVPSLRRDEKGVYAIGRLDDGHVRIVVRDEELVLDGGPPAIEDLRTAMRSVWEGDFGLRSARWISRFTDAARQAESYREGRVLLAGDAAHVQAPMGGQGLNVGLQDAVNLGWKLAQVVRGVAPDELLDSYQAERHPVAARAAQATMAITALMRNDARSAALRDTVAELMGIDAARRTIGGMLSGLDLRYDLGEGHPLLGRRMPDLDLVTAEGPRRVYDLLHDVRPLLLNLGEPGAVDAGAWADRVQVLDAACAGPWELPVLGAVAAPAAVLVRPDGHVAWVGEGDGAGEPDATRPALTEALGTWFGPPA